MTPDDGSAKHANPVYVFLAAQGDTFHMGFGLRDAEVRFRNAYHAYSDDGGVSWKKSDGTAIALPITPAKATCAYYDAQDIEWSRVLDIAVDADGTPAMLFYYNMPNFYSGSGKFLDMTVSQLRWDGSEWQLEDILTPAPYHRATRGVYACHGAQKPGDIDTVVVMEGQHGVYAGSWPHQWTRSDPGTIVVPCRARAVLYHRSEAGWQRIGPITSDPETYRGPAGLETFETRAQWVKDGRKDLEIVLSRVTHYPHFYEWRSSLIGVAAIRVKLDP